MKYTIIIDQYEDEGFTFADIYELRASMGWDGDNFNDVPVRAYDEHGNIVPGSTDPMPSE